jgi:hypothetical protein
LPGGVEGLIRERVEAVFAAKLAEYKRVGYAFLLGLGLVFSVLIGDGLLSKHSLLVFLHDEVFGGFEKNLASAMARSVNFSYSNQFWLDKTTSTQFVTFYADKAQNVNALIEIKHSGGGQTRKVTIKLDNNEKEKIWDSDQDLDLKPIDLTSLVRGPCNFCDAPNVHHLTFSLDGSAAGDIVSFKVLLNVLGMEALP